MMGDLEREIIVHENWPHQSEQLVRDKQAVPGNGGPVLNQW